MEALVTLVDPDESGKIADGLSHVFPLLAISAGTVSIILIIYFIIAIALKISSNKRTIKMQNDIRIMREIMEKNAGMISRIPKEKLPTEPTTEIITQEDKENT